jgi:hypothetical protein
MMRQGQGGYMGDMASLKGSMWTWIVTPSTTLTDSIYANIILHFKKNNLEPKSYFGCNRRIIIQIDMKF